MRSKGDFVFQVVHELAVGEGPVLRGPCAIKMRADVWKIRGLVSSGPIAAKEAAV
jgi:hypothetical protein|tara:strand:- start:129 stop:293 length:165 start_codon:yes stop_codon:yes gene_type:complete